MMAPMSPLPSDASELERQFAEQTNKVVRLAKAGLFENMPAEQQRLEQLKVAVRTERNTAAKSAKAAT